MAASPALQRQRALHQRVDTDVMSLVDNFTNMIKAARVNESVRNTQEMFQIEVHASRIINAAESLLKLISELKQTAVFGNIGELNQSVEANRVKHEERELQVRKEMLKLGKRSRSEVEEELEGAQLQEASNKEALPATSRFVA